MPWLRHWSGAQARLRLAELTEKLHDSIKHFFQLLFFMLRRKIINIRQVEIIDSACGKYFDASQKVSYQFDGPAEMVFQVALPDNDNIPSQRKQLRSVPVITLNIF